MIKNQCYIREFTPAQRRELEAIAAKLGIKTSKGVLLFILEDYQAQVSQKARLEKYNAAKTEQIQELKALLNAKKRPEGH